MCLTEHNPYSAHTPERVVHTRYGGNRPVVGLDSNPHYGHTRTVDDDILISWIVKDHVRPSDRKRRNRGGLTTNTGKNMHRVQYTDRRSHTIAQHRRTPRASRAAPVSPPRVLAYLQPSG